MTKTPRISMLATVVLLLCACSSGGGTNGPVFGGPLPPNGGPVPFGSQCNPGTQVLLADPQDGQFAPNVSQITIVANGNNNSLATSFSAYVLVLDDTAGDQLQSSNLSSVSDPNGPHPFSSDFYYQATLSQPLIPGENWSVNLGIPGQCTPIGIGQFNT